MAAAVLFAGMLLMVLVGIHVVILGLARSAVASAADAAVTAAQAAGPDGPGGRIDCDDDPKLEQVRVCEAATAARVAMAASRSSIVETRPPAVDVQADRGVVRVIVFGGTISPLFGGIEVTAEACGPLDDIAVSELSGTDVWQC